MFSLPLVLLNSLTATCKKSSHIKQFFFKNQHTAAKHGCCRRRMTVPFLERIPWAFCSHEQHARKAHLHCWGKSFWCIQRPSKFFQQELQACFKMHPSVLQPRFSHKPTPQVFNVHWLFGLWQVSRDLDKQSYYPVYIHWYSLVFGKAVFQT